MICYSVKFNLNKYVDLNKRNVKCKVFIYDDNTECLYVFRGLKKHIGYDLEICLPISSIQARDLICEVVKTILDNNLTLSANGTLLILSGMEIRLKGINEDTLRLIFSTESVVNMIDNDLVTFLNQEKEFLI